MEYQVTDDILKLQVDSTVYNEAVVYKCFYWYCRDFNVEIEPLNGSLYNITLQSKSGSNAFNGKELVEKIKQDLIDFKLRNIIATETKTIRELIVAKAFANFEIEEIPQTIVSDPVGFDPQNI